MKTTSLILFAGMLLLAACSSQPGEPSTPTSTKTTDGRVEPVVVHGIDTSFPRDTTWFALTAERCAFYAYVPERGDYRARVLDTEGNVVKVVYESGLKPGVQEISFNPQPMEPGSYLYMLTKNILADTVQVCRFDIQPVPDLEMGG